MKIPAANDTIAPACEPIAPIFLRYRDSLLRYIHSKVDDPISREDLLSEVMIKLYDQCERLETIKNVEAWLIGMARNTVMDYFRANSRNKVADVQHLAPITEMEVTESIDIESCVHSLIALLPEKYGGPLRDYELKGIPQAQLAKTYGIGVSGIKSRIQRARIMLKELFNEYCSEAVATSCQCDPKAGCD